MLAEPDDLVAIERAERPRPTSWSVMFRCAATAFSIMLALTSCGLDEASAGVEVVSDVEVAAQAAERGALPAGSETGAVGDDSAATRDDAAGGSAANGESPARRSPDGAPLPMPGSVAVVGDSLTVAANDQIESAFVRLGFEVIVVDAMESRRMVRGSSGLPSGIDAIDEILTYSDPELWIIALGTNDVGARAPGDRFRGDVASVLARIPVGAPVIWVDLWIRDRFDSVVEANRIIRSVAGLRPATNVVDWHGNGDEQGIIIGDGVHLTPAGRDRFAASIAATVREMFIG